MATCPGNWWCGDRHHTRFTALSAACSSAMAIFRQPPSSPLEQALLRANADSLGPIRFLRNCRPKLNRNGSHAVRDEAQFEIHRSWRPTSGSGKLCVWQRNEQKPIKHSEKLIYSTRSRPTVHHRIRGENHARTSTKPLCGSSKRLLRSIKPLPVRSLLYVSMTALLLSHGSLLFLRTRLRRNHACYAIVNTQLTVNLSGMFD
jgi:hypothetical protein